MAVKDRTEQKVVVQVHLGWAGCQPYSIYSISQVTLGPRESLLIVASGTGGDLLEEVRLRTEVGGVRKEGSPAAHDTIYLQTLRPLGLECYCATFGFLDY